MGSCRTVGISILIANLWVGSIADGLKQLSLVLFGWKAPFYGDLIGVGSL